MLLTIFNFDRMNISNRKANNRETYLFRKPVQLKSPYQTGI